MSVLARTKDAIRDLPAAFGRQNARTYIPELDGLRCIAILFVLVWHASLRAARYIDHLDASDGKVENLYRYFPHGEIGVVLFFFISGFVVSQPFVTRPRTDWKIGAFYKRRLLRIYPPYLVAITLCFLALAVVGYRPIDANAFAESTISLKQSFLASLVYLHGIVFDAPSPLNPPMWSLEIEVLFYALLPLLMLAYCRGTREARIALTGFLIGLAIAASSVAASTGVDLRLRWGLAYHLYLFLLGIVAADLIGEIAPSTLRKSTVGDVFFAAGVAVIVKVGLMMTANDARMIGSLYALKIQAMTVVALVLVFVGAFHGRLTSAVLSFAWLRLVGTMCYSLYLTHIVVMTAASAVLAKILKSHDTATIYLVYVGVLVGASLLVGAVFYLCVERPFALRVSRPRARRHDATMADAIGA